MQDSPNCTANLNSVPSEVPNIIDQVPTIEVSQELKLFASSLTKKQKSMLRQCSKQQDEHFLKLVSSKHAFEKIPKFQEVELSKHWWRQNLGCKLVSWPEKSCAREDSSGDRVSCHSLPIHEIWPMRRHASQTLPLETTCVVHVAKRSSNRNFDNEMRIWQMFTAHWPCRWRKSKLSHPPHLRNLTAAHCKYVQIFANPQSSASETSYKVCRSRFRRIR